MESSAGGAMVWVVQGSVGKGDGDITRGVGDPGSRFIGMGAVAPNSVFHISSNSASWVDVVTCWAAEVEVIDMGRSGAGIVVLTNGTVEKELTGP
jgi:hypothetical protein